MAQDEDANLVSNWLLRGLLFALCVGFVQSTSAEPPTPGNTPALSKYILRQIHTDAQKSSGYSKIAGTSVGWADWSTLEEFSFYDVMFHNPVASDTVNYTITSHGFGGHSPTMGYDV